MPANRPPPEPTARGGCRTNELATLNKEKCPLPQCREGAASTFPPHPPVASQQNLFRAFFHGRSQPPPPRCAPALIAAIGPSAATAQPGQRVASVFPRSEEHT